MDVSSFLKWNDQNDADPRKRRLSGQNSTFSAMQDNITQFFQNTNPAYEVLTPEKNSLKDGITAPPPSSSSSSNLFTDKLVERLISMALPSTNELIDSKKLDQRLKIGKTRPSLSVPLMSKNFMQLNARLSVPFELIDSIIRVFKWENPFQTVTVMVFITHLILTPLPILISFPFFFIILNILVPNFVSLHQPDYKDSILGRGNPILSDGSNLKAIEFVKPAPEISREFIINLTDLQNHMLLYVNLWDSIDQIVRKFGYFVDDGVSSFWFIVFLIVGGFLLLFGETIILRSVILIKFLSILGIWGFILTFHPQFHDYFYNLVYSEDTRYYLLNKTNNFESFLHDKIIVDEIDEPQEQREVEIFEIQQLDSLTKEWRLIFYLNDDFTRYSSLRINYFELNLPIGSTSLSFIKPPNENWVFTDNNWKIDLHPDGWVNKNLLFEFVNIDDETKWVYDKKNESKSNEEIVQFRRRRWTRSVARHVDLKKDLTSVASNETTGSNKTGSSSSTGTPSTIRVSSSMHSNLNNRDR